MNVFFYIYGNAFTGGDSTYRYSGPDFIMEFDSVLVAINYRFGPFGDAKLTSENMNYTGNAGSKYQRKALEWVKININ